MAEEQKIEIIDPWTQTSKGLDPLRNVEALPPDIADQTYGKDNETLDAGIALRNLPKQKVYTPYVNHSSRGAGTGLQSITGVGFKPSVIVINAILAQNNGSWSEGHYSSVDQFVNYTIYNVTNFVMGNQTNYIIFVKADNGGGGTQPDCRATLYSIDSDGFTLNWTTSTGTAIFTYICYP